MDEIFGAEPPAWEENSKLSGSKSQIMRPSAGAASVDAPSSAQTDPSPAWTEPAAAGLSESAGLPEPVESAAPEVPETSELIVPEERRTSDGSIAFVAPLTKQKKPKSRRSWRPIRFVLGFAFAAGVVALILVAAAQYYRSEYANRIVQGVHIGTVDVSGLTPDEATARVASAYAYVSQGKITVATASGSATIGYDKTGRVPNVAEMVFQAMRVGHTGDPYNDTLTMLRTSMNPVSVPLSVNLDPTAVATEVRKLVATDVQPKDATISIQNPSIVLNHAVFGKGIDEVAISKAIVDHLASPDQGSTFEAGGAFITIKPAVTDDVAQAAIDEAQKMLVDIKLVYTPPAPATPSPNASATATATPTATPTPTATAAASGTPGTGQPKSYTINASTVLSWISFSYSAEGKYVASVDLAKIQSTVTGMNMDVSSAPVEPSVTFDPKTGRPTGVVGGVPGTGLDTGGTSQAIADYLESLVKGGSERSVDISTVLISPQITPDSLKDFVIVGAWTTIFYPDISNGYGANIRVPARIFNGQVVAPHAQFSFLQRVGPVDQAHGFALGGVIVHGKSDHTGAMGGGICSASTTMFNAAARAGFQIDERHNHAYYINRYPVGLDATVFSNGWQNYDMKWTNDSPNPVIIRGTSTKGSRSTITIQLWSLPLNRTVTFSPEYKANVVGSHDSTEYTTKIPPGTTNRAEYPTDGFDTSRTRTVIDKATGKVLHEETWKSRYIKVDGILQIGVAPTAPPPNPTPAASAAAIAPQPSIAPRRRTGPGEDESAA